MDAHLALVRRQTKVVRQQAARAPSWLSPSSLSAAAAAIRPRPPRPCAPRPALAQPAATTGFFPVPFSLERCNDCRRAAPTQACPRIELAELGVKMAVCNKIQHLSQGSAIDCFHYSHHAAASGPNTGGACWHFHLACCTLLCASRVLFVSRSSFFLILCTVTSLCSQPLFCCCQLPCVILTPASR